MFKILCAIGIVFLLVDVGMPQSVYEQCRIQAIYVKFSTHRGEVHQVKWEDPDKLDTASNIVDEFLKQIHSDRDGTVSVHMSPPKELMTWDGFKAYTGNSYPNPAEEALRKEAFERNLKLINEQNHLNSISLRSSKLKITSLSDMTEEQYERYCTGELPYTPTAKEVSWHASINFPHKLNYAKEGYVGKIRKQGDCEACWAMVAAAMAEALHVRATRLFWRFSPQFLLDCDNAIFDNEGRRSAGCEGGYVNNAFEYIIMNGIALESSYPYIEKTGRCDTRKKNCVVKLNRPGYIQLAQIPSGDELSLKEAVFNYGPMIVKIFSNLASFQHHGVGVYADVKCRSLRDDEGGHAMLLIGYGTDDEDGDYWLLLNTWGTGWGEKGFRGMEKINNGNMCGIASRAFHQTFFTDW
ncbi:papain family cysteine protease domain-containing protein [Ditylenchus destructor]|uniref:Papain family cysteine protease domain-containing protein n=1 Tax=Ditylenchus destructor TaxID=166010 RepID=A0AAD4QZI5_9BILA|nr:papain family cysteine protease domain-containing protein [Ditylenchus destructor]